MREVRYQGRRRRLQANGNTATVTGDSLAASPVTRDDNETVIVA